MTTSQAALTLTIAAATLALMLLRPRGLHEAWAAVAGGALMLLFHLETPAQAFATVRQSTDVLLFLLALMILALLLDRAGFFEWSALVTARSARGSGARLFRNVFLLGAACTALLSLDTTAIILTPVVLALVKRLGLTARPFLLACAFVANTGSLLLPVSNLTNLLFASALDLGFPDFVARMALPQVAVLTANYWLFRFLFRGTLPTTFDVQALPAARSVVPDRPFFIGAVAVLGGVLVGYFVGALNGVPPYLIALLGAALLLGIGLWRRRVTASLIAELSWPLFPFVVGLFLVVRGVQNLGLAGVAASGLRAIGPSPLLQSLASAVGAGLGTNLINNIPMALLSLEVLQSGPSSELAAYGALLGCNIGPNLTVVGSLATMLVITSARQRGEELGALDFARVGIVATPLLLGVGSAALFLALTLLPLS